MKTFLRSLGLLVVFGFSELHAAGSLKVTLAPSQAVSAGAQWRVDGGGWQNSGATKSVSAGSHTVDFKTITGWLTPAATNVTITNGATTSVTATYVQPAALTVTLSPTSGQWRVDGGAWRASGATATGLVPGNHTVDYAAVSGYASPPAETVTLVSNQTTALARSYTQLAQLQVTLTPTTAQWRIDGGTWQNSGVTVANLAPGTHTVDYIALAGYTAPASESVTLASGQSLALTRSYIQLAQLTVTLSPATAQWSVDGGAWQASGVTVANLSPSTHTVTYAALSGYIAPAGESVTLASGQSLSLSRAYVQLASITVTLNPSWVMWRVDGGTIVNSGVTVGNLAPGSHTIDYFGQSGWAMPPSETVTLTAGQALALTRAATQLAALTVNYTLNAGYWRMDGGTWNGPTNGAMDIFPGTHAIDYQPRAGWIAPPSETITAVGGQSIVLNPAFVQLGNLNVTLVPASAQWNVDGNAWQPSGNSWSNLTPGTHTVNYSAVSGYLTPASESLTITSGQTLSISRTYVAAAQVTLTLTPATAQWRLDGGAWQTSGATIGSLAAGDHGIDYQSLNGYTAPASETVTLTAGQSLSLTRSYIQLAQLSITLTPTGGQWRVDGGAWQASGATIANLTPGDHAVDYSTLQNYSSPAAETVTLTAGQSQTLTRAYVQYAQILIGLVPSSGQWRANGGAWQASGTSLFVPPGTYAINYSALDLYDSPPSENITLTAAGVFATTRNYVSQKPTLRINLTPGTGQWRVDGGTWQNSGAQVIDLAVGSHAVDYTDIGGDYAPLASESISLALRENATLTRAYALKPASITVTLSPANAQWRADGGTWQASGATVANLAPGNHSIDYAALSGYTTPASETVALTAGQSLAFTRSYPQLAQLAITLTPATAQWRLDGGAWQSTSTMLNNLSLGAHTIDYSDVAGYITPPSESLTLVGGANTFTRSYTPLASLTVTLTPTSAQWRVDGGAWQNSGTTLNNLSLGSHTVDYSSVAGYTAPPSESVTLVSGPNSFNRNYTPLASVTVNLTPTSAQWRLDGGAWQASGATLNNLTSGAHTVDYGAVTGYSAPPSESITLASGQTLTLARSYTALASLTVILSPASAQWRLDGGVWQASGTTLTNLAPGSHTIDYSAVAGYTAPPSETVSLTAGQSTVLSHSYVAPTQINVALNLGAAQWRVDGGTWQAAGASVTGLGAGPHLLEFSSVTGYTSPLSQTITLNDGDSINYSFLYVPQSPGLLNVKITPASGQWRVDGGAWNISGDTVGNLTTGTHALEFADVLGYITPTPTTVNISPDDTMRLNWTYDHGIAGLQMALTPSNARWRVDGWTWLTITGGVSGNAGVPMWVEYEPVPGYSTPHAEYIKLPTANPSYSYVTLTRTYQPTPTASFSVKLNLEQGQWRIYSGSTPNGTWQTGSATVHGLAAGGYTVEYAAVAGYGSPTAEAITLAASQEVLLTRNYTSFPGQVTVTINAPGAHWGIAPTGTSNNTYFASGETATNLPPGKYTISYYWTQDYLTPWPDDITLSSAEPCAINKTYEHVFDVKVWLNPYSTSQWRIDGGSWLASGQGIWNVAPGTHTIDYSVVDGYAPLPSETITFSTGNPITLYRNYNAYASLTVSLSPYTVGQWRVDGGSWQATNATVGNLSYDVPHTVEYADVPGYVAPASETVTLNIGQQQTLYRSYNAYASLTVSLYPNTGQWRVDGGPWQASDATVQNLTYGVAHTIEYAPVAGYTAPPTETVTLYSGPQTLNRSYSP